MRANRTHGVILQWASVLMDNLGLNFSAHYIDQGFGKDFTPA